MTQQRFSGMRTFLIVWVGQLLSRFGTYMTAFGLFSIWLWERTEKATALALVSIIGIIGAILAALIGGVLVDRFSRKALIIIGDGVAGLGTTVFLILFTTDNLEVWHLYAGMGIIFFFNQIHGTAYSAAITMMVPKAQHARAGSLRFLTHYGAVIFAPPLAAALYGTIGLEGIMIVDILTVSAAIATVAFVEIPQPPESEAGRESRKNKLTEALFGFRYIWRSPSLRAMAGAMLLFTFAHDMGSVMHTPMILSRTGNNVNVLAAVGTAAGLGGLTGAIYMSWRGGPQRRIKGWLIGSMGAGLAKSVFSLGRSILVWFPAQFLSSVNFPIRGGLIQSIWMSKIEPDVQGRFFAATDILGMTVSGLAQVIGATLADQWIEPAMQPDGALSGSLGWLFGTGDGAGFAVIYFVTSICLILIGFAGFFIPAIRNIEDLLVDY
jgi:MFS family permease